MKVFKKINQQDFPKPTHTNQRQRSIGFTKWLFAALFFCNTWMLQAQWVFHIDCPCDMYPAISVSEHSGLEDHDRLICRGEEVTITATGGHKYIWSTGDTTNVIKVDQAGGYGVTISDAEGCQAVENVLITEYSRPYLDYKDAFCSGYAAIKVKGTNIKDITWNDGSDKSYLNVTESGTYSAIIKDGYNCTYVESATITKGTSSTVDILVKNDLGHQVDHTICEGEVIDLHASSGFVYYRWSSSDGVINSTGSTLFVQPTTTTTYTVVATDASGCTATKSITIVVNKFTVDDLLDQTICKDGSVQLSATGGSHYTWSPTTGLSNSTISNPVASPETTTTYSVVIKNSKGCKVTKKVTVSVIEDNTKVGDDQQICLGESVTLSASGGTHYTWSPSTGLNHNTIATPIASPVTTTTYTVLITNASGCTATHTQTVVVNAVDVTIQGETEVCPGESVTVDAVATSNNANSIFTYAWNALANLATSSSVVLTPPTTGTYVVTVRDTLTSCTAVDSILITVNELQVEAGPDISVCLGDSVQLQPLYRLNSTVIADSDASYVWNPTVGINDPTVSNPIVSPSMTTTYTVTLTDGNGCTAVDSLLITINDLQVDVGSDLAICQGDSVQLIPTVTLNGNVLTGTGSNVYTWSPTTGINDITLQNPIVFPTTTDTYIVTIRDTISGCSSSDSIIIAINNPPLVIAGSIPDTICQGDTLQLTETGGEAISWSWEADVGNLVSSFIDNTTIQNPRVINAVTGDLFYVTVTDSNGCTGTDSFAVVRHPNITFERAISPSPPIVQDTALLIVNTTSSGGPYSYSWTPTIDLVPGTETNDTALFIPQSLSPIEFTVVVTDESTGCTREAVFTLNPSTAVPPMETATISGRIFTEAGEVVENTIIDLTGYPMPPEVTGATGSYEFESLPMHDHYLVSPKKDIHPLNGVSTFDLILISKHILGIQPLTSPYQLIAADANRSGSITVFDIVEIRKLLLRANDSFTNNTSWRFVDANYEFKDPTNPFRENFPENYPIQDLQSDMTWLDFIAVKIGDVNNSVAPNSLVNSESRDRSGSLVFTTTKETIEDGETIVYHFSTDDTTPILGYQFTLAFDPTLLEFDRVMPTSLVGEEYFGLSQTREGVLTSSWNKEIASDLSKEASIFSLAFKRKKNKVRTEETLFINSNKLQAEAYSETGSILELQLIDQLVVPEVALDKIELYQNRPNPFTGMTTIGFDLPTATTATLRIFDTTGKVIKVYEEDFDSGYNELIVKSKDLTEYGALYYQLATPTQIATKKMIHTH